MITISIIRLCAVVHLCIPEEAKIVCILRLSLHRPSDNWVWATKILFTLSDLLFGEKQVSGSNNNNNNKRELQFLQFYILVESISMEAIPSAERRHSHSISFTGTLSLLNFFHSHWSTPWYMRLIFSLCTMHTYRIHTWANIFSLFSLVSFNLIENAPKRKLIFDEKMPPTTCRIYSTRHIACVNRVIFVCFLLTGRGLWETKQAKHIQFEHQITSNWIRFVAIVNTTYTRTKRVIWVVLTFFLVS